MLKCVPCEDEGSKPFVYQEVYGLHIQKLTYKSYSFFGAERLQYTKLMPAQKAKIDQCKAGGYEMINGFAIYGQVFSDPNDNKSGTHHPETNVIIMASEGVKGAIAVLPTGEVLALTSKSWKPETKHFKI